jgi:hypothetical protein
VVTPRNPKQKKAQQLHTLDEVRLTFARNFHHLRHCGNERLGSLGPHGSKETKTASHGWDEKNEAFHKWKMDDF